MWFEVGASRNGKIRRFLSTTNAENKSVRNGLRPRMSCPQATTAINTAAKPSTAVYRGLSGVLSSKLPSSAGRHGGVCGWCGIGAKSSTQQPKHCRRRDDSLGDLQFLETSQSGVRSAGVMMQQYKGVFGAVRTEAYSRNLPRVIPVPGISVRSVRYKYRSRTLQ